jgi:arginyl-tRNA synthetase
MFEAEVQFVESSIRKFCAEHSLPDPGQLQWSPIPFAGQWGIATSLFQLAAKEARAGAKVQVAERAQELAESLAQYLGTPPGFARVEAVRGYLNLYYLPGNYARRVVDQVLEQGERFGRGEPKGERVMVEFSQPNTHKAFHVGHLRTMILGATVSNILEWAGYEVVRANYIGDIGLHVIQWLWNYRKYHAGELPGADKTRWMGDLYAEAVKRLEEHPEFETEVRDLFARWDRRDPEVVSLWEQTRRWSLEGFEQIYQIMGIHFDRIYFESEMEQPGKALVEELIARGIAIDERPAGPVIVRIDDLLGLKKETYRVLVILRSDGTSLYSTKDLALAIQKFEEYDLDYSVYVIDVRQSLYLKQIFKTLEIMGYPWAKRCYHLAYELVNLPGNVVMSSREGAVVLLEDLIREAIQRARQVVEQKNPMLAEGLKQEVATAVGLGALKYAMLARDNTKLVTFDWESALDFNGQAAPYIQYAHVRANSILRRYSQESCVSIANPSTPLPDSIAPDYELDSSEIELVDLISRVPNEIQRAAAEYKPLHLTNLAYEIARAFTDFYDRCPVIKAEPSTQAFRVRLVAAVRQTIANLLYILGIAAPQVM